MKLTLFGLLLTCGGLAMLFSSGLEIRGAGLAGLAAGGIGLLLLGAGLGRGTSVESPEPPPPPGAVMATVKARVGSLGLALPDPVLGRVLGRILEGRKIEAIKILRVATGRDLKDSKQAVDAMEEVIREAHPPGG